MSIKVLFLHGLESKPGGSKHRYLSERFDAMCPELDTSLARELKPEMIGKSTPKREEIRDRAFARPLASARAAIAEHKPDVIVGSSFGGAVLLRLCHEGSWDGPVVFLAGAGVKLTKYKSLPPQTEAMMYHGAADDVVDCRDSLTLEENSEKAACFLIQDDHRLHSLLENEHLASVIQILAGKQ